MSSADAEQFNQRELGSKKRTVKNKSTRMHFVKVD